jgi:glycosyltransferase involved in cell wall biosynthesis
VTRCAAVIPCYRHERFVAEAIESVLAQTRPPDRFLVVDDGSPDGSAEVVAGYSSRGVELVRQENAGAHATLNRAVARVAEDCDVVAILDSDDAWEPRRLELCLDHLESRPDLGVVCTRLRVVDAEGRGLPDESPRRRWFDVAWSLGDAGDLSLSEWLGMANFPATTSNVVARAGDLLARPFRPYRFCHDYSFLLESALRERLGVLDETLLRYRVHDDNTMVMDPAPLVRELLRLEVDLRRALQTDLRSDPALRERFRGFSRARWDNFSSLSAGLFDYAVGELLAAESDDRIDALLGDVAERAPAELSTVPQAALQKLDLARGHATSRAELVERNERLVRDSADRSRYHAWLMGSKWLALGRLLGLCTDLVPSRADDERLRRRVRDSRWVQLGATLRIGSAVRLLELSEPGR